MLLHIIDFEGNNNCGIVEYGVVTLQDREIHATYSGMCKPDEPMSPKDIMVHGLRNEQLSDYKSFSDYRDFFYELRQTGGFGAHHASVENRLLCNYWSVVPVDDGKSVPSMGSWGPWIDSRVLAQRYIKSGDFSLGFLVNKLGLAEHLKSLADYYCPDDRRKAHCALYDAIASALIVLYLQDLHNLSDMDLIRFSQSRNSLKKDDYAQGEFI